MGGVPPTGALVGPASLRWMQALEGLRHDVYHLPAYATIAAGVSGGQACAFSYVQGSRRFFLPLVLREIGDGTWEAASPYGYPGPLSNTLEEPFWAAALATLSSLLEQRRVVTLFVRLHPQLTAETTSLQRFGTLVRHGETVSLDLRQEPAQIVAGFRTNHRRQIDRARRSGVRTVIDRWELLDAFIDAYYETMTRVGATADYFFPRSHFHELVLGLPGAVHLIAAVREDALLAAGLFFHCQDFVQYHLGATAAHGLPEQPMKLVFDATWRWAKEQGAGTFHLGGGVGGAADSLFHFKAGFSPRRHVFQTLRVVVDPPAYRRLCADVEGCAAEDLTAYFPAFRQQRAADQTQIEHLSCETLPSMRC
ncbi:MAG: hypothetical protein NVS3B26_28840 [Mycobacteriales bacterium]